MDNKPKKLYVGQKVWVNSGSFYKNEKDLVLATISKVGKKYFYTDTGGYGRENKFDKQTMTEDNGINYKSQVYLDPQDYYEKKEKARLLGFLKKYFIGWDMDDRYNLSLEKLRQIKAIVEGEK